VDDRTSGLEIEACHLPLSKQNMNMADQNWVGPAIWLTTELRAESSLKAITVKWQFVLPISRFTAKDSFVLCMDACMYVHNLWWLEMADQSSKCPTNIILGQPFVLAKVKCHFYPCVYTPAYVCTYIWIQFSTVYAVTIIANSTYVYTYVHTSASVYEE
jgi:hypothetical protein